MTQIDILLSREAAIEAIDGRKITFTESERKGEIGDTFIIENPSFDENNVVDRMWSDPLIKFRIVDIHEVRMCTLYDWYYRLEGFDSQEAFVKSWRDTHDGKCVVHDGKKLFIHFFGRIM